MNLNLHLENTSLQPTRLSPSIIIWKVDAHSDSIHFFRLLNSSAGKQVLLANHADQYMIKSLVTLYNDGTCLWDSLAILESSCDVDVTSFPFSKQECHLIFTSGKYDSRLMDIHPMPSSTEENNSGIYK